MMRTHWWCIYPAASAGAPGGICYGLKEIYGDNAVCCYVEPTQAPCMLLGLGTGKMEQISCADVGLSGKTAADGLAVGRPSGLVARATEHLVSCEATVNDRALYRYQRRLWDTEGIFIEPSACAGFHSYVQLAPVPAKMAFPLRRSTGAPKRDAHYLGDRRQPRPGSGAGDHAANRNERRGSFAQTGHLPIKKKSAQAQPARFLCVYSDVLR